VVTSRFVFDASPLVASCQFAVGTRAVAEIALTGADVQIPPAVYTEVVTRGGTRPDALIAARLIQTGYIRMVDATGIMTSRAKGVRRSYPDSALGCWYGHGY
jgi:hypothetical protein